MTQCKGKCTDGKPCTYNSSVIVEGTPFCKVHVPQGECAICLDAMTQRGSTKLKCEHRMHTSCIQKWVRKGSSSCPLCRCELTSDEIHRFYPDKDKNKKVHNVSIHQIDAEQLLQLFGMDLDAEYIQQLGLGLRPHGSAAQARQDTTTQNMLTITILSV